jgi:5-methylcytosine-specific restriction endonuclease McrA
VEYHEIKAKIRAAEACEHKTKTLRKKLNRAGIWQVMHQCDVCGKQIGQYVSYKAQNIDLTSLSEWNVALAALSADELKWKVSAAWKLEKKEQIEQKLKEYDAYIASKEWRIRADKALKRDNYLCQSCGTSKATEVHHLTYFHLYDEPLFDLVSVCNACHVKLHPEERMSLRNVYENMLSAADE